MGGNESSNRDAFIAEPYITISDTSATRNHDGRPGQSNVAVFSVQRILTTGFSAIWTMHIPTTITPCPRNSHFMVNLPGDHHAIIGYGIDKNNQCLNDIWALDTEKKEWRQLKIDTSAVAPRNGAGAVLCGRAIAIFGGFSELQYVSDFHVIHLDSMTISRPTFTNEGPRGRIGHVMAEYQGRIMIWGGYNGDWLSDLWILDTSTLTWREIETPIKGRTSATFATHGNKVYIYGAAKVDPLIQFDWETETLSIVQTTGSNPPPEISQASMVAVDRYLLLFGGKLDNHKFGLMYGYDTDRKWWFVFHVVPDGNSTSISDGIVDRNGFFLVPRISSASIVYRRKTRDVMLFLGAPLLEPPNLGIVELGHALAILNHQSDMFNVVHESFLQ